MLPLGLQIANLVRRFRQDLAALSLIGAILVVDAKRRCTAPGFSDTRQRYAASCAVIVAAIQFRLVSAGLR
jgi:hypothetical protein